MKSSGGILFFMVPDPSRHIGEPILIIGCESPINTILVRLFEVLGSLEHKNCNNALIEGQMVVFERTI